MNAQKLIGWERYALNQPRSACQTDQERQGWDAARRAEADASQYAADVETEHYLRQQRSRQ